MTGTAAAIAAVLVISALFENAACPHRVGHHRHRPARPHRRGQEASRLRSIVLRSA